MNSIYNGNPMGPVYEWIDSVFGSITNTVVPYVDNTITYTAEFFQNIASAIVGSVGSIFYYPILAIISFLALIQYVLYILVSLASYLMAPIWFIINLITGFWVAFLQNYSLVYLNDLYTNNSINNFIAAIPGYSTLMIVINASLWLLLALHIMTKLKKI